MQVLLVENYPALGYVGDTVQVKNGYARNYLIPRGIAVDVSSRRAKHFEHLMSGVSAKRSRLKSEAEELGKQVSQESLSFELKLGAGGKSFGSISSKDALKQLQDKGYQFEKKQVRLADIIKAPGDYVVTVQLHSEVSVEVPVSVAGIKQKEKTEEPKGKKARGGARSKRDASAEGLEEDGLEGEESLEVSEEFDSSEDFEGEDLTDESDIGEEEEDE